MLARLWNAWLPQAQAEAPHDAEGTHVERRDPPVTGAQSGPEQFEQESPQRRPGRDSHGLSKKHFGGYYTYLLATAVLALTEHVENTVEIMYRAVVTTFKVVWLNLIAQEGGGTHRNSYAVGIAHGFLGESGGMPPPEILEF